MKKLIIPILILISVESFNQSVERAVVASAGNDVSTETMSISWTLGEAVVSTLSSNEIVLTQGFQQGNLIIDAIEGIHPQFQLKAYPNPVIDKLIVESVDQNLLFEILDVHGRLLNNGFITSNPFELDFTSLPSGAYFLRVERKITHKIIKR